MLKLHIQILAPLGQLYRSILTQGQVLSPEHHGREREKGGEEEILN